MVETPGDLDAQVRALEARRLRLRFLDVLAGIVALGTTVLGVLAAILTGGFGDQDGSADGLIAVSVGIASVALIQTLLVAQRSLRRIRASVHEAKRDAGGVKVTIIRDKQVQSMLVRISSEQADFSRSMSREVEQ